MRNVGIIFQKKKIGHEIQASVFYCFMLLFLTGWSCLTREIKPFQHEFENNEAASFRVEVHNKDNKTESNFCKDEHDIKNIRQKSSILIDSNLSSVYASISTPISSMPNSVLQQDKQFNIPQIEKIEENGMNNNLNDLREESVVHPEKRSLIFNAISTSTPKELNLITRESDEKKLSRISPKLVHRFPIYKIRILRNPKFQEKQLILKQKKEEINELIQEANSLMHEKKSNEELYCNEYSKIFDRSIEIKKIRKTTNSPLILKDLLNLIEMDLKHRKYIYDKFIKVNEDCDRKLGTVCSILDNIDEEYKQKLNEWRKDIIKIENNRKRSCF